MIASQFLISSFQFPDLTIFLRFAPAAAHCDKEIREPERREWHQYYKARKES